MKILYIAQARFPTEKAHGFQIAQVCGAMALLGHEVTVLFPGVRNTVQESAFSYYGIPENFTVQAVGTFDPLHVPLLPGFLAFAVGMKVYGRALRSMLTKDRADLLYLRSPSLLQPALASGIPVILELHTLPRWGRDSFVQRCNQCRLVVCLTTPMRDALLSWGVDASKVTVEADGVDPSRFAILPDSSQAKKDWKLPTDRPVLGYIGSLVTHDRIEKGVREMIDAIALLKRDGRAVFGWVVGGPDAWRDTYADYAASKGLTKRELIFEGKIPASKVPSAIAAVDVCMYPAPASNHPFFQRDTSPLKLFEYLATDKPIVCADIPPIRDVVDEWTVHFCAPGDAASMARAIVEALEKPIVNHAKREELIHHHSWEKRMERVLMAMM